MRLDPALTKDVRVGRYNRLKQIMGVLLLVLLLSGCFRGPDSQQATRPAQPPTAVPTQSAPTAVPPTRDPAAPAILLNRTLANGTLYIIGYTGPEGQCAAASFDTRTFVANHCGSYSGKGVGFVDAINDPAGQPLRIAYGLAMDLSITGVALEFSGGGNTNGFTENGAYLFVLDAGQTPYRATGVNQFGNMVGQWTFE